MESRIAELSKETLEMIQKAEKKIAEGGRQVVLIAYEAEV